MDWMKLCSSSSSNNSGSVKEEEKSKSRRWIEGGGVGIRMEEGIVLCVKVITDDQMEELRRQISVYAAICEQLVEMHKAVTAHHDYSLAPGMRLGSVYCDPFMTSGGHKMAARQRWTPTPVQLQILESIFDQGNGTPSKQKIKDITLELTQHGQISETNVYNWFQNRRARSKRKQTNALANNTESEPEAEIESPPSEKKAKSTQFSEKLPQRMDNFPLCSKELSSEEHYINIESRRAQGMPLASDRSKSSSSLGQMSFYENTLSNPRIDHLMEKMEVPGSYSPFQPGESYEFIGSPL